MTIARDRMLELSALPSGSSARAHFLSIVQGGSFIASELEIEIMEIDVEINNEIAVEMTSTISVEIEDEIQVEMC